MSYTVVAGDVGHTLTVRMKAPQSIAGELSNAIT
jgi:hypothetical protein